MKFLLLTSLLSGASAFTAPTSFVTHRGSPLTPLRMSAVSDDGMGGIYDDLGFKQEEMAIGELGLSPIFSEGGGKMERLVSQT